MKFSCNHVQACKLIAYLKGYFKVERFVVAVVIAKELVVGSDGLERLQGQVSH